jgi:GTP pyrophosphokinase
MKKFLAIMLALVMLLTLAACGGNKDNNGDETPSGNDVEQTTEPTTEAKPAEKEIVEPIKTVAPKNIKSGNGVIVDGERGCLVKFAHCCNPLPGDDIIGFVTKGFGVSIHKSDCPNVINGLKREDSASRWVEAHWEISNTVAQRDMYEAHLRVAVYDRIGILADISVALADMKVYILQINTTKDSADNSVVNLKVSCKDVEHYRSIVSRLRAVKGVIDVTRGFS